MKIRNDIILLTALPCNIRASCLRAVPDAECRLMFVLRRASMPGALRVRAPTHAEAPPSWLRFRCAPPGFPAASQYLSQPVMAHVGRRDGRCASHLKMLYEGGMLFSEGKNDETTRESI